MSLLEDGITSIRIDQGQNLVMSAIAVAIRIAVIGSSTGTKGIVVPACPLVRVGSVVIVAVAARTVIAINALDLGCFGLGLCGAIALSPAKNASVARRIVFQFLVRRSRAVRKGDRSNAGGFAVDVTGVQRSIAAALALAKRPPRTLERITDVLPVKGWALGVFRVDVLDSYRNKV